MIRVLVADDSEVVRNAVASTLESYTDIEVVGLARNGVEATEKTSELVPDVVVMDVEMPAMDGLEAARRVKQALPRVGILLISASAEYQELGIAAGGDGYLAKPFKTEELLSEVRRIAAKADA